MATLDQLLCDATLNSAFNGPSADWKDDPTRAMTLGLCWGIERLGMSNGRRGSGEYHSALANQFLRSCEPSFPRTEGSRRESRNSREAASKALSSTARRVFTSRFFRTAMDVNAMSRSAREESAIALGATTKTIREKRIVFRIITHRISAYFKTAMGRAVPSGPANRPPFRWALWACILCFSACGKPESTVPVEPSRPAEAVSLKSVDGIEIKADWTPPKEGPVFLVMHGLGAGRGEWKQFSVGVAARGAGVLAFDARGHGESGGGNYKEFKTVGSWASILNDFDAAFSWLATKGISEDRIVLGGASLGANLSVHAGLKHPKVRLLLLLSPGQIYAGIPLQPALHHISRPIIIAAARSDQYSYASSGSAVVMSGDPKPTFLETQSGHGVGMFNGEIGKGFLDKIIEEALK